MQASTSLMTTVRVEDRRQVRSAATRDALAAARDVDVEGDREVGVVAHVQVARHLRVAADDLVDERVGQEDVERVGEVVARRGELGSTGSRRWSEVIVASLDVAMTSTATDDSWSRAGEHLDEVVALAVDRVERTGQLLEGLVDRRQLLLGREREPVERLDRVDDVFLVVVELAGEDAQLAQHGLRRVLAALEGQVELLGDGLELRDAAAVEQQAQRAEHLLDLRVAAGALDRDGVAVPERVGARALGGRAQLTNFSPRRLVWRSSATALSGSSTSRRISSVTRAW